MHHRTQRKSALVYWERVRHNPTWGLAYLALTVDTGIVRDSGYVSQLTFVGALDGIAWKGEREKKGRLSVAENFLVQRDRQICTG